MVHFSTCVGCKKRSNCDRQEQIKSAVRGSGVTSIKHRCPERECLFFYGQPVIVRTYSGHDEEGEYFSHPVMGDFPGHFLEQRGSKAICFIRKGALDVSEDYGFEPRNRGFVKVPLSRIQANPEGDVLSAKLCELCKDPVSITGQCGGFDDPANAGSLCAVRALASGGEA